MAAAPAYLGRDPAAPAAEYASSALSEACHHRAYEVGLTEAELRAHLRTADSFRVLVGGALAARLRGLPTRSGRAGRGFPTTGDRVPRGERASLGRCASTTANGRPCPVATDSIRGR